MAHKIRINLANSKELRDELGLSEADVDAIMRFRGEHGPIENARQLDTLLGGRSFPTSELDFSPSESTAPEAPGA
jgi:hypothetical protein